MKKKAVIMFIILPVLIFSCNLPDSNNLYGLVGEWSITERPADTAADYSDYETLIFTVDKYQIKNKNGEIFESGSISNAAENSYNYTMERYDPYPDYEGAENCAVFSINGDELTITFYSDDKADNYGTLKAKKQ